MKSGESPWQMPPFEADSGLLFTVFGNQVEPPLQKVNFFFSDIQRNILGGDHYLFLQVTKLFTQMVPVIRYSQSSNGFCHFLSVVNSFIMFHNGIGTLITTRPSFTLNDMAELLHECLTSFHPVCTMLACLCLQWSLVYFRGGC